MLLEKVSHHIIFKYYSILVFFSIILLGGGTEKFLWSDQLIQILALPVVIFGILNAFHPSVHWNSILISAFIIIFLGLQFLNLEQLVPIPNSDETAFQQLWSVSPARSMSSVLFTMTCLGLFFFVNIAEFDLKIKIIKAVFAAIIIQGVLAIVQLSYSARFELLGVLPFTITSGLFANENHFSALLFIVIPILGYVYLGIEKSFYLFFSLVFTIVILLFAIGSKAGMVFAILQLVLTMVWYRTRESSFFIKMVTVILGIVISIFLLQFSKIFYTLDYGIRPEIFKVTWIAIKDVWLTGYGLGSFEVVYPLFEPIEQFNKYYINHAHNDYLELFLELGIFVFLPIFIFIIRVIILLLTDKSKGVLALSVLAIMAHSLVDYPLRTFSVSIVFIIAAAILLSKKQNTF